MESNTVKDGDTRLPTLGASMVNTHGADRREWRHSHSAPRSQSVSRKIEKLCIQTTDKERQARARARSCSTNKNWEIYASMHTSIYDMSSSATNSPNLECTPSNMIECTPPFYCNLPHQTQPLFSYHSAATYAYPPLNLVPRHQVFSQPAFPLCLLENPHIYKFRIQISDKQ